MEENEEQQVNMISEDSEPLVINTVKQNNTDLVFKQKLALVVINIIVVGYNTPLYAFYMALELDVNNRIGSEYNISERNVQDCLNSSRSRNKTEIHNHIESVATNWLALINAANLIPAFFVSFIGGPISDQIGRKVAILVPTVGAVAKYFGCLLISFFQWPIWAYTVVSFAEGLTGGIPLIYTGCVAYTVDNTNTSQRSFWIVMVDLSTSLSAVIGTFCNGYIISGLGFTWSYIIMGIVTVLTGMVTVLLIQGSPMDLSTVEVFTTKHFKRSRDLFTKDNGTGRRWKLNLLLVIVCLAFLGNIRQSDVLTFLMLNTPLCFSSKTIGDYFSILHVVMTVGGFLLIFLKRFGAKEIPLLYVAFMSMIGLEILVSLAQTETVMFSSTLFSAAMVLGAPLVNTLMSGLVGPDEQGALFSAVSWLVNFTIVLSSTYQNALYSVTVSVWSGVVLVVAAGAMVLAIILLTILVLLWRNEEIHLEQTANTEVNSRT